MCISGYEDKCQSTLLDRHNGGTINGYKHGIRLLCHCCAFGCFCRRIEYFSQPFLLCLRLCPLVNLLKSKGCAEVALNEFLRVNGCGIHYHKCISLLCHAVRDGCAISEYYGIRLLCCLVREGCVIYNHCRICLLCRLVREGCDIHNPKYLKIM